MNPKLAIYAAGVEEAANEVRPILVTKTHTSMEVLDNKKCADAVVSLMHSVPSNKKYKGYLNNYLCSYLPDNYLSPDEPKSLFTFFVNTWEELSL